MATVFLLFFVVGLFLLAAAVFNWDWQYGESLAHFLSTFLGESGARWYTGLAGMALVIVTVIYWVG